MLELSQVGQGSAWVPSVHSSPCDISQGQGAVAPRRRTLSLAQNRVFLSAVVPLAHGARQLEVPRHCNGNKRPCRASGGRWSRKHPHPSPSSHVNLSLSGQLWDVLGTRRSPGVSESSGAHCVIRPDLQMRHGRYVCFPTAVIASVNYYCPYWSANT